MNDDDIGEIVPFAWTLPGDDTADCYGWIPTRVTPDGEFTKPLYSADALERLKAERDEWKQAAGVEAGLRREFLARAEAAEAKLRRVGGGS